MKINKFIKLIKKNYNYYINISNNWIEDEQNYIILIFINKIYIIYEYDAIFINILI